MMMLFTKSILPFVQNKRAHTHTYTYDRVAETESIFLRS